MRILKKNIYTHTESIKNPYTKNMLLKNCAKKSAHKAEEKKSAAKLESSKKPLNRRKIFHVLVCTLYTLRVCTTQTRIFVAHNFFFSRSLFLLISFFFFCVSCCSAWCRLMIQVTVCLWNQWIMRILYIPHPYIHSDARLRNVPHKDSVHSLCSIISGTVRMRFRMQCHTKQNERKTNRE